MGRTISASFRRANLKPSCVTFRLLTVDVWTTMNLSLYAIQAVIILDTEGHRVLAKYYNPSKEFQSVKEQKAFEKGLWQKTKKPGGSTGPTIHQPNNGHADRRHHPL